MLFDQDIERILKQQGWTHEIGAVWAKQESNAYQTEITAKTITVDTMILEVAKFDRKGVMIESVSTKKFRHFSELKNYLNTEGHKAGAKFQARYKQVGAWQNQV